MVRTAPLIQCLRSTETVTKPSILHRSTTQEYNYSVVGTLPQSPLSRRCAVAHNPFEEYGIKITTEHSRVSRNNVTTAQITACRGLWEVAYKINECFAIILHVGKVIQLFIKSTVLLAM